MSDKKLIRAWFGNGKLEQKKAFIVFLESVGNTQYTEYSNEDIKRCNYIRTDHDNEISCDPSRRSFFYKKSGGDFIIMDFESKEILQLASMPDYTIELKDDGIKIGCQEITIADAVKVADAIIKKYRNE